MQINSITRTDINTVNFSANPHKRNAAKIKEEKLPVKNGTGISLFTTPQYHKRYMNIIKNLTPAGQQEAKLAHFLAKKYVVYKDTHTKCALITPDHYYIASLMTLLKFAKEVDAGTTSYEAEKNYVLPQNVCEATGNVRVWGNKTIKLVIPVIEEEIKKATQTLEAKSKKNGFVSSIEIDKDFMHAMDILTNTIANNYQSSLKDLNLNENFALLSMQQMGDRKIDKKIRLFFHKIDLAVASHRDNKDKVNLSFYNDISQKILKNLDRGYNINVIHSNDEKENIYLVNNLLEEIKKTSKETGYKNLNTENTNVTTINETGSLNTIQNIIQENKDNSKHLVFIFENMGKSIQNSYVESESGAPMLYVDTLQKTLDTDKKNVHFILIHSQNDFYQYAASPAFENIFSKYQMLQLPIMDQKATKKALLDTKQEIEDKIGTKISQQALMTACELTSEDKGSKYSNAVKFLENVASYYIDEKEIKKEQVMSYWENSKKVNAKAEDGSYEIIFDTKKGLKDIIGSPMVRQQAELAAYEIKNFPQTKGYIIYNSDGVGGGRLNCAKAIAGEAKIPMVIINAADFAIRDLDTINRDPMEAIGIKIKKLMDIIKSQAQTNPNKTIMLFISNFDNFGADPLTGLSSIYEQQAFNKILKEMKKAQEEKDYNLIVVGSSELPNYISENIRRPGLFSDEIIIYPPTNRDCIKDIAIHHIKKKNYKIQDGLEDKNTKTLKHFSNLVLDSSYVDIVDILDKANLLAKKENRDEIAITDLNKAYLIKYVGMPSNLEIGESQKEAITRHEGGHALNLQFMYDILKEKGDNLRISDSASIITLDPRGDYLGCVMHNNSEENTVEENLETVFAKMVCAFGGNSAEEHFYNLKGSWGISQDLKNANYWARIAVLDMGLGKNMGYYIPVMEKGTRIPRLTKEDEENYTKDVKTLIKNAKILSDKIIECYHDFLVQFSDEHVKDFGGGNCVVTGVDFADSLHKWEKEQSPQKKAEIYQLKKEAFKIIEAAQNGEVYQK